MKTFGETLAEGPEEITMVDPFRCRMWDLHDRLDEYLTEESCRQEIDSFTQHGQLLPVLGRHIRDDPEIEVELIYGARRLFVARHLNRPIGVKLREISDRDALIAMDVENRHRKNVSAYERGLSYARWIRKGHFSSQDDIARMLRISASQVSRLLKLARLPSLILSAFESPMHISEKWGLELADAWADLQRRPIVARNARLLVDASPRPPAREVYARLLATTEATRRAIDTKRDEIVRNSAGVPLYKIKRLSKTVVLALPRRNMASSTLDQILRGVTDILQRESEHSPILKLQAARRNTRA
jgi:ParB family chromosome partitioning protein